MTSFAYCQATLDDYNDIMGKIQKEAEIIIGLGAADDTGTVVFGIDPGEWGIVIRHYAYQKFKDRRGITPQEVTEMYRYVDQTREVNANFPGFRKRIVIVKEGNNEYQTD